VSRPISVVRIPGPLFITLLWQTECIPALLSFWAMDFLNTGEQTARTAGRSSSSPWKRRRRRCGRRRRNRTRRATGPQIHLKKKPDKLKTGVSIRLWFSSFSNFRCQALVFIEKNTFVIKLSSKNVKIWVKKNSLIGLAPGFPLYSFLINN